MSAGRRPIWLSATAWLAPLPPSISSRLRTGTVPCGSGTPSTTSTRSRPIWPTTAASGTTSGDDPRAGVGRPLDDHQGGVVVEATVLVVEYGVGEPAQDLRYGQAV